MCSICRASLSIHVSFKQKNVMTIVKSLNKVMIKHFVWFPLNKHYWIILLCCWNLPLQPCTNHTAFKCQLCSPLQYARAWRCWAMDSTTYQNVGGDARNQSHGGTHVLKTHFLVASFSFDILVIPYYHYF